MRRWVIVVLSLFVTAGLASAQTETPVPVTETPVPPGEPVTLTVQIASAADGQILIGSLYYPAIRTSDMPGVLLMHQNNGRRADWTPLIPPLTDAGYVVLAVDLRGFGETGGARDFAKTVTDTQDWLAYLQAAEGVDPARTAAVGASIGANLALVGCSENAACVTAVALSPGLNFFNVMPEQALIDGGLSEKSALLVVSQRDTQSIGGVKQMLSNATGEVGARIYSGGVHGTGLFASRGDSLISTITCWLDEQMMTAD